MLTRKDLKISTEGAEEGTSRPPDAGGSSAMSRVGARERAMPGVGVWLLRSDARSMSVEATDAFDEYEECGRASS